MEGYRSIPVTANLPPRTYLISLNPAFAGLQPHAFIIFLVFGTPDEALVFVFDISYVKICRKVCK